MAKVKNEVGKLEAETHTIITEVDTKIDKWFTEHFHGVVGMTTEVYNKALKAKERLKLILKEV